MQKDKMGRTEFIVTHIIWTLASLNWYENTIFRCIGRLGFAQSAMILRAVLLTCSVWGVWWEIKRNRNVLNIVINLTIPYGIYTAIAYAEPQKYFIIAIVFAVAAFSGICAVLILGRKIRNRKKRIRILRRRIKSTIDCVRDIVSIGMAVILLVISGTVFLDTASMYIIADQENEETENEEKLYSENRKALMQLQPEIWRGLSVEEKLDILQTVAQIEAVRMGLTDEICVRTEKLQPDVLGYYMDDTREIVIDLTHISDSPAEEVLESLLHEVYHSFEHRLVDLYLDTQKSMRELIIFEKAEIYLQELTDYENGNKDIYEYQNQSCEKDARDFAQKGVEKYYDIIYNKIRS